MYEQGRREPSLGLLVRLAQEFGVTTDYLLMGETPASDPLTTSELPSITVRTEALIRLLSRTMK
jgi:transcriptional regulator with XRE-family HTH domain